MFNKFSAQATENSSQVHAALDKFFYNDSYTPALSVGITGYTSVNGVYTVLGDLCFYSIFIKSDGTLSFALLSTISLPIAPKLTSTGVLPFASNTHWAREHSKVTGSFQLFMDNTDPKGVLQVPAGPVGAGADYTISGFYFIKQQ